MIWVRHVLLGLAQGVALGLVVLLVLRVLSVYLLT